MLEIGSVQERMDVDLRPYCDVRPFYADSFNSSYQEANKYA